MSQTHTCLLDLLDQWRHLPDYQLERRADIFFAAFLPDFLSSRLGVQLMPSLIPEFPVRLGTIYPGVAREKQNCSRKIDYVALAPDLSQSLFVELKTDMASLRDRQDEYLNSAQRVGLRQLVAGVVEIVRASRHKHKYGCLLRLLEAHSLLKVPPEFDAALASTTHSSSKVNDCLSSIEITSREPAARVLYLQPKACGVDRIGFAELADWLDARGGEMPTRFARSLREWARVKAGRGGISTTSGCRKCD